MAAIQNHTIRKAASGYENRKIALTKGRKKNKYKWRQLAQGIIVRSAITWPYYNLTCVKTNIDISIKESTVKIYIEEL